MVSKCCVYRLLILTKNWQYKEKWYGSYNNSWALLIADQYTGPARYSSPLVTDAV